MRANTLMPPTSREAFSIGDISCMPILLGITYDKRKALPKKYRQCLIPGMETPEHIGQKLKKEAERLGLKPAEVAALFEVKPPSVYDWYYHGRIHKKHYPTLVEKFGRPLEWWLDFPMETAHVSEQAAGYGVRDQRHSVLVELFDCLPAKEQDELIKTLTEKKQHYDAVINEFLSRRHAA